MKGKILGGTLAAAAVAAPMGAYYEGVFPVGYLDPVGIPTDCIGETHGAQVGVQRFTFDQCVGNYSTRLKANWDNGLANCIFRDVTVPQGAALMSFADNAGIGNTCGSTMVRLLNAGAEPEDWCAQMLRWTYAHKFGVRVELPGLVKRRNTEYHVCVARDVAQARNAFKSTTNGG